MGQKNNEKVCIYCSLYTPDGWAGRFKLLVLLTHQMISIPLLNIAPEYTH